MRIIFALVIALAVTVSGFAQADPVEGYWISIDENTNKITAGWQIYQENGVLFGKILSLADNPRGTLADHCTERHPHFPVSGRVNRMEVAGTPWIHGLRRHAEGDWRNGNIVNPEDGARYSCRVTFRPAGSRVGRRTFETDHLEMRGEIGLGIGRSQYWQKADQATASNLWPN
jgi:uncharacterized protein (DUF2147 family)